MNGTAETDVSPGFTWSPEYDRILENLASSDYVQHDWNNLRDMIKYKLKQNIASYLLDPPPPPPPEPPVPHPEPPSASPESASTITTLSPGVLSTAGAKFPPFPKREENRFIRNEFNSYGRAKAVLGEAEVKEMYEGICRLLHEFEGNPPFTIQRLCELIVRPRRHFKYTGKYLRAVERSLLVTSTIDAFPVISAEENEASSSPFISVGSLREATTPLFSPIPFLHEDARRSRSRSRSPPMSPLNLATNNASAGGPAGSVEPLALGPAAAEGGTGAGVDTPAIGLVDELDDPSPGHLSDHPTALSSTTTTTPTTATGTATRESGANPSVSGTSEAQVSAASGTTPKPMFGGSLQERFVKGSSEQAEIASSSASILTTESSSTAPVESSDAAEPRATTEVGGTADENAQSNSAKLVASDNNGMVVDEPDADKENAQKSS